MGAALNLPQKAWIVENATNQAKQELLMGKQLGDDCEYSFHDIWVKVSDSFEDEMREICLTGDENQILELVLFIRSELRDATHEEAEEYAKAYAC